MSAYDEHRETPAIPPPHPDAIVGKVTILAAMGCADSHDLWKRKIRKRLRDPIALGTKTLRWRWRDVCSDLGIPVDCASADSGVA